MLVQQQFMLLSPVQGLQSGCSGTFWTDWKPSALFLSSHHTFTTAFLAWIDQPPQYVFYALDEKRTFVIRCPRDKSRQSRAFASFWLGPGCLMFDPSPLALITVPYSSPCTNQVGIYHTKGIWIVTAGTIGTSVEGFLLHVDLSFLLIFLHSILFISSFSSFKTILECPKCKIL